MRNFLAFSLFVALSFIPVLSYAVDEVTVDLIDSKGAKSGKAFINEIPNAVDIRLEVTGLTPGPHAFHIHETGKCDAPNFKSAGPHFNPGFKKHGTENPEGHHAGDLPNIFASKDGKASLRTQVPGVTLSPGAYSLLKKGGTALVIHAAGDDEKTDPAGNAGDRVMCGVISGGN